MEYEDQLSDTERQQPYLVRPRHRRYWWIRRRYGLSIAEIDGFLLAVVLTAVVVTVCALSLSGCVSMTLTGPNGEQMSYYGMKIFSPTVTSLQTGDCQLPNVSNDGVVTEPTPLTSEPLATAAPCTKQIAQVNGVDLKGLMSIMMTTALGIFAGLGL